MHEKGSKMITRQQETQECGRSAIAARRAKEISPRTGQERARSRDLAGLPHGRRGHYPPGVGRVRHQRMAGRERARELERERERASERDREKERARNREKEREKERKSKREREKERECELKMKRERESKR